MSSLSALKYKITINQSYYAGLFIFLLYSGVIALTLLVVSVTLFSLFLYLLLFVLAVYSARKAYLQNDEFLLSDSGLVERFVCGTRHIGKISGSSFYNAWFIYLKLDITSNTIPEKKTKQSIIIYTDAIREDQFRLLARLINSG